MILHHLKVCLTRLYKLMFQKQDMHLVQIHAVMRMSTSSYSTMAKPPARKAHPIILPCVGLAAELDSRLRRSCLVHSSGIHRPATLSVGTVFCRAYFDLAIHSLAAERKQIDPAICSPAGFLILSERGTATVNPNHCHWDCRSQSMQSCLLCRPALQLFWGLQARQLAH